MSHDPTAPPPPPPSTRPHLTPQFCFNTTALRDFLRLSRASVDDSLSLHLNALLQPARRPLSPPTPAPGASTRRQIPGATCAEFKRAILFPSWADRELVLSYCGDVAASPPGAATAAAAAAAADEANGGWGTRPAMRMPSDKMGVPAPAASPVAAGAPVTPRGPRTFWGQEQVTDERTDPYSGRDYSYTHEDKAATLRSVLENEAGVERIVRARTWRVLGERCLDEGGDGSGEGYEAEWRQWMETTGR